MSDSNSDDDNGLNCLAFGPKKSFFVDPADDEFTVFWSGCDYLNKEKLTIKYVAFMGSSGYYVRYSDGSSELSGLHPDLSKLIKKEGVNWITFGSNESYILETASGLLKWWGIPDDLSKAIKKWEDDLVSVSLGRNNSYCAIFKQSSLFSNIPDGLQQIFNKNKTPDGTKVKSFNKVWLSAYDDRYYLWFNESAGWWISHSDYFDHMMKCDEMLKPFEICYTNDSVAATFTDGRSIYDTARDLNNGNIGIEAIPMMEVFRCNDQYFSKNNRRLWAFRNSGVYLAPVKIVDAPAKASTLPARKEVYVRYKKS